MASHAKDGLEVAWHAGEPLVVGPEWYEAAMAIVPDILERDRVHFRIQSNATLLSSDWVDFLRRAPRTRISLSIDGPAHLHDAHRRTRSGRGTHVKVMESVQRLQGAGVAFACIAVVSNGTLDHVDEFYEFFAELRPSHVGLNVDEVDGANTRSSLLRRTDLPKNEARFRSVHRRRSKPSTERSGPVWSVAALAATTFRSSAVGIHRTSGENCDPSTWRKR
jgi:uncharacterized protein